MVSSGSTASFFAHEDEMRVLKGPGTKSDNIVGSAKLLEYTRRIRYIRHHGAQGTGQ